MKIFVCRRQATSFMLFFYETLLMGLRWIYIFIFLSDENMHVLGMESNGQNLEQTSTE